MDNTSCQTSELETYKAWGCAQCVSTRCNLSQRDYRKFPLLKDFTKRCFFDLSFLLDITTCCIPGKTIMELAITEDVNQVYYF